MHSGIQAFQVPDDFMFVLEAQEVAILRSQFVTARSWGGERYPPMAFTEQGVAMQSERVEQRGPFM